MFARDGESIYEPDKLIKTVNFVSSFFLTMFVASFVCLVRTGKKWF